MKYADIIYKKVLVNLELMSFLSQNLGERKEDLLKSGGGDTFVGDGFKNWKKKSIVYGHIGGPNNIKAVTLKNAPENLKLTSPDIQKHIVSAISVEIVNTIASELGDSLFAILVDESRDLSSKEQMAIVLRYVDDGNVIERFVGIEHVTNTNAITLKEAIDDFLCRHRLSISRQQGQGYDGASNMRGEMNGLKTLILNENKCAFYVHCFAHQLQLALVAVAKNHDLVSDFFTLVGNVVNVVGASAKRRDILREKHGDDILEALENNKLSSGQGLN
ncbi:zinc finger MYM-type protein 1-like [Rosa chinensis]|uniref:zinc finger MYM-type protein 1-like n=1 Tax=Rosa chinensis TaxID=74649 RepID=UPI000D08E05C|nr:zinc finger MYM-type protein 1-like [Rosa chinensis]